MRCTDDDGERGAAGSGPVFFFLAATRILEDAEVKMLDGWVEDHGLKAIRWMMMDSWHTAARRTLLQPRQERRLCLMEDIIDTRPIVSHAVGYWRWQAVHQRAPIESASDMTVPAFPGS